MSRLPVTLAALVVTAAAACGQPVRPGDLAGWPVDPPRGKPDFTLTATDGRPFDFRRDTERTVALLFFGYTRCPDVCPVHLANIAAALQRLDPLTVRRVRVVFVTTDPARDSLAAIRKWLDHFDTRFVGLHGPIEEVNRIQAEIGQGGAFRQNGPGAVTDSGYAVAHGASVFVYTADDSLRIRYPFGVRQAEWARDLPRLVAWYREERP